MEKFVNDRDRIRGWGALGVRGSWTRGHSRRPNSLRPVRSGREDGQRPSRIPRMQEPNNRIGINPHANLLHPIDGVAKPELKGSARGSSRSTPSSPLRPRAAQHLLLQARRSSRRRLTPHHPRRSRCRPASNSRVPASGSPRARSIPPLETGRHALSDLVVRPGSSVTTNEQRNQGDAAEQGAEPRQEDGRGRATDRPTPEAEGGESGGRFRSAFQARLSPRFARPRRPPAGRSEEDPAARRARSHPAGGDHELVDQDREQGQCPARQQRDTGGKLGREDPAE